MFSNIWLGLWFDVILKISFFIIFENVWTYIIVWDWNPTTIDDYFKKFSLIDVLPIPNKLGQGQETEWSNEHQVSSKGTQILKVTMDSVNMLMIQTKNIRVFVTFLLENN
jgi:hypothetical protein